MSARSRAGFESTSTERCRRGENRGEMRVRDATAVDAGGIARVHYQTWQTAFRGIVPDAYLARTTYEARKSAWESCLNKPNQAKLVCVAEDASGQIVGFAVGGPERTGDPTFDGELEAIYILQSHQRQGIGRRLVLRAVEWLSERGLTSMVVWTLADSPYRRFYEILGGEPVRESERDFGGTMLRLVGYGWSDIQVLVDTLAEATPSHGGR
jgi:GNAT superfamily N-acetyltransferase